MSKKDYKNQNLKKAGIVTVGTIAAGSLIGCGSNDGQDRYDSWMDTDGAAGRINMDAVKLALEKSKDMSDFETRVNEIFEGENLILIKSQKTTDGQTEIMGFEDLDNDGRLDVKKDDKLFSAVVGKKDGKDHMTMSGHGSNSHYNHHGHFSGTDMLFMYWMMSSMYRPYYTPYGRTQTIRTTRTTYRKSDRYGKQKARNSAFKKTAKAKNPQAFKKAQSSKSPARSGYQSSKQGKFGGKSGGGKSGGFRGGS